MPTELQLRRPSPLEAVGPYLSVATIPVAWAMPYSLWTWVVVALPSVLRGAVQLVRLSRPPRRVTPRAATDKVDLLDAEGRLVDVIARADVEAVTMAVDPKGRTEQLRVDRRGSGALLFVVADRKDARATAAALSLDMAAVRSRHRGASLAMKFPVLHALGILSVAWLLVGKTDPEVRSWISAYFYFVWLPVLVLSAVPTWIDVARDGIGWRWLFVRRFVPFTRIVSVIGLPKGRGEAGALRMRITMRDGQKRELPLGPWARGVLTEVRLAMAAPPNTDPPIEGWLQRGRDETARAWIQRVRDASGAQHATERVYRGIAHERLWEIAEDPASGATPRCGALLVLCADEAARPRARALASTTADPSLGAAIEALANGAPDEDVASLVERTSR